MSILDVFSSMSAVESKSDDHEVRNRLVDSVIFGSFDMTMPLAGPALLGWPFSTALPPQRRSSTAETTSKIKPPPSSGLS